MTEQKSGSVNTSERGTDPLTDEQMSKVDQLRSAYRDKHNRISDIGARELLALHTSHGEDDEKTIAAMEDEKASDTELTDAQKASKRPEIETSGGGEQKE